MKRDKFLILITFFSIVLFTGCSVEKMASSSVLRTVGLGESVMPVGQGAVAVEFFNDQANTVDVITEISSHDWDNLENDLIIIGSTVNDDCRYFGFNTRLGFDNSTEVKVGYFRGSIENGYDMAPTVDENDNIINGKSELNSSFTGTQVGIKRLLTEYDNPHRLSLYLDGKYITFKSEESVKKYDAHSLEFKSAIIYGFLPNPDKRSFPSISLYYSRANTKRKETISIIPQKKQPQAIGAEVNLNVDFGLMYANLYTGVETEIADKATDEQITYFGVKLGFLFNRKK